MAKFLLTDVSVEVNGQDLSNHAFSIDAPEDAEQVEVSGFNPGRLREYLQGLKDQTITIQFLQDFASGGPHAVLEPLFTNGTVFNLWIKPTSAATSSSNPKFGGSAQIFSYNGLSGQLNARSEISVTFKPASNQAFSWHTSDV